MKKYIFLDIDGVLNREREFHANGAHGTDPDCVARLNRIILASDPEIVISSSWRKYIHRGHMTLIGLEKLLMTHGVDCECRLVGITRPDDVRPTRGELITLWLTENASLQDCYVVLDDGSPWTPGCHDHGIRAAHQSRFIQTNPDFGLTNQDVLKAIKILGRSRTRTRTLKWL